MILLECCDNAELRSFTPPGRLAEPVGETVFMVYSRWPAFTETRLRPLARRRDSTARPLLVFIRERKPCVFERRRRLGWNVRFGIENCAPD